MLKDSSTSIGLHGPAHTDPPAHPAPLLALSLLLGGEALPFLALPLPFHQRLVPLVVVLLPFSAHVLHPRRWQQHIKGKACFLALKQRLSSMRQQHHNQGKGRLVLLYKTAPFT